MYEKCQKWVSSGWGLHWNFFHWVVSIAVRREVGAGLSFVGSILDLPVKFYWLGAIALIDCNAGVWIEQVVNMENFLRALSHEVASARNLSAKQADGLSVSTKFMQGGSTQPPLLYGRSDVNVNHQFVLHLTAIQSARPMGTNPHPSIFIGSKWMLVAGCPFTSTAP